MKRLLTAATIILTAAMLSGLALSGCATDQKPAAIAVEEVTASAEIVNIDAAKRIVTVKLSNGSTRSYALSKEVKNFDQIKIGDLVKITALESVAIFVRKVDEQPDVKVEETVTVASKGEKPGMIITDTFELIARIEAIDIDKGTITLKGPEGDIKSFAIKKSEDSFKNVKVGDSVVLDVTVAVMIAVEKPAAKTN
jgi:hypothetical protein